jgi:hypothetical protein
MLSMDFAYRPRYANSTLAMRSRGSGCAKCPGSPISSVLPPPANAGTHELARTHESAPRLDSDLDVGVASASGFGNILVHGYAEVDDHRVTANLEQLDDLANFVRDVASWLTEQAAD